MGPGQRLIGADDERKPVGKVFGLRAEVVSHTRGDDVKLRELLVAARQRAGLTQQEVANELHRPQSFVAKYEGGERRLDVIEFVQVARALGADPLRMMRAILQSD